MATTIASASHCRARNSITAGLLLDFKELKLVMKPVVEYLDHKMINDIEPFTVLNPTAENLAKYFFDQCNSGLKHGHRRPRHGQAGHHLGDRHLHRQLLRVAGSAFGASSRLC